MVAIRQAARIGTFLLSSKGQVLAIVTFTLGAFGAALIEKLSH